MANVVIKCNTECRLTNPENGLEEHYEDEVAGYLYEVTEERAQQLMLTGNFGVPAPGAIPHASYAPVPGATAVAPTPVPDVFTFPAAPVGEEGDGV